jgi:hypothetical protein
MGTDTGDLWVLVLMLEAAILVALAITWSWRRWGHVQTWIIFFPLVVLLGCYLTDQVTRLLPNLM